MVMATITSADWRRLRSGLFVQTTRPTTSGFLLYRPVVLGTFHGPPPADWLLFPTSAHTLPAEQLVRAVRDPRHLWVYSASGRRWETDRWLLVEVEWAKIAQVSTDTEVAEFFQQFAPSPGPRRRRRGKSHKLRLRGEDYGPIIGLD